MTHFFFILTTLFIFKTPASMSRCHRNPQIFNHFYLFLGRWFFLWCRIAFGIKGNEWLRSNVLQIWTSPSVQSKTEENWWCIHHILHMRITHIFATHNTLQHTINTLPLRLICGSCIFLAIFYYVLFVNIMFYRSKKKKNQNEKNLQFQLHWNFI